MKLRHALRARKALAVCLTAVAIATLAPAYASAQPDNGSPASRLASWMWPNVKAGSGPDLVSVDLANEDGSPLEGAIVVASVWPSFEARHSMKKGDTFSLIPLERANVSRGRATLHATDGGVLQAVTSRDGTVKVQLDVYTADGKTTVVMAERLRGAGGRWVDSGAMGTKRPAFDGPMPFRLKGKALAKVNLPSEAEVSPVVPRNHQGVTCSVMEYGGLLYSAETIGTTAIYKGIKADMNYSTTAYTRSDLGFQLNTGIAWEINGSQNKQSTVSTDLVAQTGSNTAWTNREWRATWAHDLYWRHCVDPFQVPVDYNKYITQRFTEPYKATGFPAIIDSRYSLPGCVTRHDLSGSAKIYTETHAATSYVQGFSITAGAATFKGASQSGYSTTVRMTFTNPTPGTYWYWCGDNAVPQDSYRVRAGR